MQTQKIKPHIEDFNVLFEDSDIIAIDKPNGIVVNKAASVATFTIQDWVESQDWFSKNKGTVDSQILPDSYDYQYGTPQEIFTQRAGIAHRIDKATSGILLIGKHPSILIQLLKIFKERTIKKEYICLTHGRLPEKESVVNAPIGRSMKNRQRFTVTHDGRQAITLYKVLSQYRNTSGDIFSLVQCQPKTGRTHQIRVHMKYLQCPLVGDPWYLGKRLFRADSHWCQRLFLHASQISFTHPRTGEPLKIESSIPQDLIHVLESLEKVVS